LVFEIVAEEKWQEMMSYLRMPYIEVVVNITLSFILETVSDENHKTLEEMRTAERGVILPIQ
jgi:hypothetical protein